MFFGILAQYIFPEDEFTKLGFCGCTWQWGREMVLTSPEAFGAELEVTWDLPGHKTLFFSMQWFEMQKGEETEPVSGKHGLLGWWASDETLQSGAVGAAPR